MRTDLVAPKAPRVRTGRKAEQASQGKLDLGGEDDYRFPPLDLLHPPPDTSGSRALNRDALEQNARLLSTVLEDFGIRGEIVKAYVVAAPGADVSEDELIAYCRENLVRYKVPAAIAFVDALPKTGANKIDKLALKGVRR